MKITIGHISRTGTASLTAAIVAGMLFANATVVEANPIDHHDGYTSAHLSCRGSFEPIECDVNRFNIERTMRLSAPYSTYSAFDTAMDLSPNYSYQIRDSPVFVAPYTRTDLSLDTIE